MSMQATSILLDWTCQYKLLVQIGHEQKIRRVFSLYQDLYWYVQY